MSAEVNEIKKNRSDLVSIFLILVVAVAIWFMSNKFPNLPEGYPGPNLFPRVIAIGFIITSGLLLLSYFNKKPPISLAKSQETIQPNPLKLISALVAISLFPILSPVVGFIPALCLSGIAMGFTFSIKWWKVIVVSISTTLMVYILFSQLLGVPL